MNAMETIAALDDAVDAVTLSIPAQGETSPPVLTVVMGGLAFRTPRADTRFEQMMRALRQSPHFDHAKADAMLARAEPGDHALWREPLAA